MCKFSWELNSIMGLITIHILVPNYQMVNTELSSYSKMKSPKK